MQEKIKEVKKNTTKLEKAKDIKPEKKESCRFLFDMIGRLFSRQ